MVQFAAESSDWMRSQSDASSGDAGPSSQPRFLHAHDAERSFGSRTLSSRAHLVACQAEESLVLLSNGLEPLIDLLLRQRPETRVGTFTAVRFGATDNTDLQFALLEVHAEYRA